MTIKRVDGGEKGHRHGDLRSRPHYQSNRALALTAGMTPAHSVFILTLVSQNESLTVLTMPGISRKLPENAGSEVIRFTSPHSGGS